MHFLIIVIISWFKEAHLKSGTGICSSASSKRTGTLSLPSEYEKALLFHTQQWYFLWQRKHYINLGTFKWHTFFLQIFYFYTKFPSHLKEIYCKGFRSLSMLSMTSKTSLCLYLNHLHDSGMSSWLSDNTSHQTWRCHKNYVNLIKLT